MLQPIRRDLFVQHRIPGIRWVLQDEKKPEANSGNQCGNRTGENSLHLSIASYNRQQAIERTQSREMDPARQVSWAPPRRRAETFMKERRPIFYDAERVRWRRTRLVLEISGLLLAGLSAYVFVTIAVSVELPPGLLPDTSPAYRALKITKKTPARAAPHPPLSNIC